MHGIMMKRLGAVAAAICLLGSSASLVGATAPPTDTGGRSSEGRQADDSAGCASFVGCDTNRPMAVGEPGGIGDSWVQLLGGDDDEWANDVAVSSSGRGYVVGGTASPGFPQTPGLYSGPRNGSADIALAMVSLENGSVLGSAALGGSGWDEAHAVAVDPSGHVWIAGRTTSSDLPTQGPQIVDGLAGGEDAFVMVFDSDLSSLLFGTYIGGSQFDEALGMAIVGPTVVVVGQTISDDFPATSGAASESFAGGGTDGFVLAVNWSSYALQFSSYIGGLGEDAAYGLAPAPSGAILVAGSTNSPVLDGFPGWPKPPSGLSDAFLVVIDAAGGAGTAAVLIGGLGSEVASGLLSVPPGDVVLVGTTDSRDWTEGGSGSAEPYHGGAGDGFLCEVSLGNLSVSPCRSVGGDGMDELRGGLLAGDGAVVLAGFTTSAAVASSENGSLGGPIEGEQDALLVRIDSLGAASAQSTRYFGGLGMDSFAGVVQASPPLVLAVGTSSSPRLVNPRTGLDVGSNGGQDMLIVLEPMAGTPPPPSNLSAQPGNGSVLLTWEAPALWFDPSWVSYDVFRSTQTGVGRTLVTGLGLTSMVDTNLANGIEYLYRVSAVVDGVRGPMSEEVYASPMERPSTPSNLVAVAGNGRVDIAWAPPAWIPGGEYPSYRVYRGLQGAPATLLVETVAPSFSDVALTNGVLYCYEIAALSSFGEGERTEGVCAVPAESPSSPENLTAQSDAGMVTLRWDRPHVTGLSGNLSFRIWKGPAPGPLGLIGEVVNVTSYIDVEVEYGTSYVYAISAVMGSREGDRSSEVTLTVLAVPGSPGGLRARAEPGRIHLSWFEPVVDGGAPITSFEVVRSPGSNSSPVAITLGPDQLAFSDSNVTPGDLYVYTVMARGPGGTGPNASVSVVAVDLPDAPAAPRVSTDASTVRLVWDLPSGEGIGPYGVRVYRGQESQPLAPLDIVDPAETTWVDRNVTQGTAYTYALAFVSDIGEGPLSRVVVAEVFGLPSAPVGVQLRDDSGDATLEWSPPADSGGSPVLSYRVYWQVGAAGTVESMDVGSATSFQVPLASGGREVLYWVAAVNAIGEGGPSLSVTYGRGPMPAESGSELALQVVLGIGMAAGWGIYLGRIRNRRLQ